MTTFINLTPHTINLPDRTIPPSGTIARCAEVTTPAGNLDGVEIICRNYGEVSELPEETSEDVYYIVSALVRLALPERFDLLSPGDIVRDESGKIIGAKNLIIN